MTNSELTFSLQGASQSQLNLLAAAILATLLVQVTGAVFSSRSLSAVRLSAWAMGLGSGVALLATFVWGAQAQVGGQLSLGEPMTPHALSLGLGVDRLSSAMVALVGFLGCIIVRFSATYLRSEAGRLKFLSRLTWTVTFVQLFALSTNLIGHGLLWFLISVSVHQLLRHYEERPRAVLAAKKKFLVSRLADMAFWSSLLVLWNQYGTLDLQELTLVAKSSQANTWALCGVCLAVLMKSAQFPFHSWLPETMDAPTPVSAVMHAGVVNAGAFLLLRLTPLLEHSTVSLLLLATAGAVTAAFGIFVGSVQPSLKLRLGYSTIAQMGFLFFELGLGLTGAAALHLAAHALYKAHAFLRSGTPQLRPEPTSYTLYQVLGVILLSLGAFALPMVAGSVWFSTRTLDYLPLAIVWALGSSQYLLAPTPGHFSAKVKAYVGAGLSIWAIALVAESSLAPWFPALPSPFTLGFLGPLVILLTLLLLGTSMVLSTRASFSSPRLKRLYVHAISGFYLSELTDGLTASLWPVPSDTKLSTTQTEVLS